MVHSRSIVASVKYGVASVVIDRPEAKNAMSFAMYEALGAACRSFNADPTIRVATFRGGGRAFAAGTDISEFRAFRSGEDGVAYEEMIEASLEALATIKVPTVAVIEGPAVGGGLMLAQACDIRIGHSGGPLRDSGGPDARELHRHAQPRPPLRRVRRVARPSDDLSRRAD